MGVQTRQATVEVKVDASQKAVNRSTTPCNCTSPGHIPRRTLYPTIEIFGHPYLLLLLLGCNGNSLDVH